MPAYSFQPRFVEPIRAGTKGGTIRAARKPGANPYLSPRPGGHARPGEELSLYCRQRHPSGFLIARKRCLACCSITLNFNRDHVEVHDGKWLPCYRTPEELDAFACFDGFESWRELAAFWRTTHGDNISLFDGWHIRWLPLPGYPDEAAYDQGGAS